MTMRIFVRILLASLIVFWPVIGLMPSPLWGAGLGIMIIIEGTRRSTLTLGCVLAAAHDGVAGGTFGIGVLLWLVLFGTFFLLKKFVALPVPDSQETGVMSYGVWVPIGAASGFLIVDQLMRFFHTIHLI